jgi:hypothetical protein
MNTAQSGWAARLALALGSAAAAVAASIVLPALVITAQAARLRDAHEIEDFALAVAEPVGVLGAAVATFSVAVWAARRSAAGRRVVPWIGAGAAAGLIAAAVWVLDADLWTVAAAVLMPVAALAGGMAGGRRWRSGPAGLSGGIPSAQIHLPEGANAAAPYREASGRDREVAEPLRERGPDNAKRID